MESQETPSCEFEAKSANWYAVYTRHQHEKAAANVLKNKGFETFLPLYSEAHRWKDRKQIVHLPLFPCYVFIRTPLDRKQEIVRTPGVCWLVGNNGRASAIPEAEIQSIQTIEANKARLEPHPFLQTGDRVRVRSGPLQGLEGILVRSKNIWRVVLSVQLLRQSAAVEVDACALERILARPEVLRTAQSTFALPAALHQVPQPPR